MNQPNSYYYKETPGIRNVSTREKFTVIKDITSVNGVTYEGRCQLPLDEAMQSFALPIWQLWRSGTRDIEVDSVPFTSGDHIIQGIDNRFFKSIWDNRLAIFDDTPAPFQNEFSMSFDGVNDFDFYFNR